MPSVLEGPYLVVSPFIPEGRAVSIPSRPLRDRRGEGRDPTLSSLMTLAITLAAFDRKGVAHENLPSGSSYAIATRSNTLLPRKLAGETNRMSVLQDRERVLPTRTGSSYTARADIQRARRPLTKIAHRGDVRARKRDLSPQAPPGGRPSEFMHASVTDPPSP